MQFASAHVKQEVKDKQTAAYVSGMQRAAQGEAVTDIAKDQPWYSNIFGPSDVVEGARAYTIAAKANTTIEAMRENMDTLKTMTPEAAKEHYNSMIQQAMTGDSVTDAKTMLHLTKELPVLEKQRVKAHYGYVQEQAAAAEHAYFKSNFASIQSKAKAFADGTITEEEFTAAQDDFEAGFRPVPGRNIENWQANTAKILAEEAQAGNFIGINALRRRDVGLMDALTPEGRVSVERAIQVGETNLRSKYSYQWNDTLANLEMQAMHPAEGETAADTAQIIDALNAEYKKATGSTQGLITPDKRAALLNGTYAANLRETERQAAELLRRQERADRAAERAADKAEARREREQAAFELSSEGMQRFDTGTVGMLARSPGIKKKDLDAALYKQWLARGNGTGTLTQGQISPLINSGSTDYVNEDIQTTLVGSVTNMMGKEVLDQVGRATIANFKTMYDQNPVVAKAYYGQHATALESFLLDSASMSEQDAYHNNFVMKRRNSATTQKDVQATAAAIGGDRMWLTRLATGDVSIKPGQAERMAREVDDTASRANQGIPLVDRVKAAVLDRKIQGKAELVGGYFLRVNKGQTRLGDYLARNAPGGADRPIATDNVDELVEAAVDAKLFGSSNVVLTASQMKYMSVDREADDAQGVPRMIITAIDQEGGRHVTELKASEIYTLAAQRRKTAQLPPVDRAVKAMGGQVYRTPLRKEGELPFTQPLFPK